MTWRQPEPCSNCPFNNSGEGLLLKKSLAPGRWAEILDGLRNDEAFFCHKTTYETGDGTNLYCAGALAWQRKRGMDSNFMRVMERLEYITQREGNTKSKAPATDADAS